MGCTVLSAEISVYWPLWLACVCGVILVIIALMALLLIKGSDGLPTTNKVLLAVLDRGKQGKRYGKTLSEQPVDVHFFRIGRDGEEKVLSLMPQVLCSVGSGKTADFCLDPDDRKLAEKHFRLFISETVLFTESLEKETFVNGVPIQKLGKIRIYSGDLIRAGSHEYRVMFSLGDEKENAT